MPPAEANETPKYNLPPPVAETDSDAEVGPEKTGLKSPETALSPKPKQSSGSKTSLVDFQLNNVTAPPTKTVASSTSTRDNPQIADDNDLIEKEWVNKAKQIIEANKEDPYNQSKEITVFKADYMKKRYNKTIKVEE